MPDVAWSLTCLPHRAVPLDPAGPGSLTWREGLAVRSGMPGVAGPQITSSPASNVMKYADRSVSTCILFLDEASVCFQTHHIYHLSY